MSREFYIGGRTYRWASRGEQFGYWMDSKSGKIRPVPGIASVDYPREGDVGIFGGLVLVKVHPQRRRSRRKEMKQ